MIMTIKELESQLLKAESPRLSWQGIEKTPGVCGGRACIAGTRITVWGLVNARRLGYSEGDLLENYPTLSAASLANAWAYAEAFPEEIELAIRENEEIE